MDQEKINICIAETQTAGRGRLGRTWCSPYAKNLYLSVSRDFIKTTYKSGLSLVMAIAIIDALRKYGISSDLGIKWPNDIYWQQRKLGGILLEVASEVHRYYRMVIGFGLNISMEESFSKYIDQPWVNIAEIINTKPDRNQIVGLVIDQVLEKLSLFIESGLEPFLRTWEKYDILCGKKIIISTPCKKIAGIACGIDNDGCLLIKDKQNEIQKIIAGDVSVKF